MEGAYGGGKAGAAFNPISFLQRPQVILRAVCWLFSVIIFGCISAQGWYMDQTTGKEKCLYNDDSGACNFGTGIAVIAFLASIGFLVGEFLFEQMSCVKTRKRYVMGDLGFSSFWALLFFIAFCYLTNQWSNAEAPPGNIGVNNAQGAIAFCFFSIFPWAALGYLAFMRYKTGSEQAFAPGYDVDPNAAATAAESGYTSYPDASDPQGGYAQQPFSGQPPQQFGDTQPQQY